MMSEGSRRRVVYRQLEQLCDFLDCHREIAAGLNKSMQARDHYRRRWKAVTSILNAHEDGAYKDWKGWCKYWVDYKSKLKKLVMASRASQQKTGGGSVEKKFSEIERRFLHILGEDFGSGTPGGTVEPYEELQEIQQAELCEVSLSDTGSVSLATSPVQTPPQAQPTLASESWSPPGSGDILTLSSPQVHPPSASHPGPPSPAAEARMHTGQISLRRRRRRRGEMMTAEASRRALIDVSDRRAEAEENRNRILDERLQQICHALENNNNNRELQELTLAINNLTKTINSRLPEQR